MVNFMCQHDWATGVSRYLVKHYFQYFCESVFIFYLFIFNIFIYLFIWLRWVIVAAGGLLSCGM